MKLKSGWDKWRDYEILRLKLVYEVLELCCFEWFQNKLHTKKLRTASFRAVLFRMVPKPKLISGIKINSFRAVLFRMVPKLLIVRVLSVIGFRAVLFRMVPKPNP